MKITINNGIINLNQLPVDVTLNLNQEIPTSSVSDTTLGIILNGLKKDAYYTLTITNAASVPDSFRLNAINEDNNNAILVLNERTSLDLWTTYTLKSPVNGKLKIRTATAFTLQGTLLQTYRTPSVIDYSFASMGNNKNLAIGSIKQGTSLNIKLTIASSGTDDGKYYLYRFENGVGVTMLELHEGNNTYSVNESYDAVYVRKEDGTNNTNVHVTVTTTYL